MLFGKDGKNIKGTSENAKKLHKELRDLERTSSKISKGEAAMFEKELRKKMNDPSGLSKEEYRKLLGRTRSNTRDPIDPEELRILKKKVDL